MSAGRVIFVCGGCEKQAEGTFGSRGEGIKPAGWFSVRDRDGVFIACSYACVQTVSLRTGKPALPRLT